MLAGRTLLSHLYMLMSLASSIACPLPPWDHENTTGDEHRPTAHEKVTLTRRATQAAKHLDNIEANVVNHDTYYTNSACNADRSTIAYFHITANNFKIWVAHRSIPRESLELAASAMIVVTSLRTVGRTASHPPQNITYTRLLG